MRKLHKLDDVLGGYFNQLVESRKYSIVNNLTTNKNFKFTDVIVLPPELAEDRVLQRTTIELRHNKYLKDFSYLDKLFGNFDGLEQQVYNDIVIYVNVLNAPVFVEKDKKFNDIYSMDIEYCLSEKRK